MSALCLSQRFLFARPLLPLWLAVIMLCQPSRAEPVVPGTGVRIAEVGDDFEPLDWQYAANQPKSSRDIDQAERLPAGESRNGRWYEGIKRGHPDIVQRIETPPRGLPGSRGALLLQSLHTGVPGRPRYQLGQDDLIADVNYRLGGSIPAARAPSVVVRVFLAPVDRWENRSGPHFGFRASLEAPTASAQGDVRFSGRELPQTYWVGMFIEFQSKTGSGDQDYAYLRIRADRSGKDLRVGQITTTGWWTLGMSLTSDGMVHYYARPGVEDLDERHRLVSDYPYGYRAASFKTFFFNVCSGDDGRSWSTPWVIDDPGVYIAE